jgi:outer membrane receptor protein involved in Fe transport
MSNGRLLGASLMLALWFPQAGWAQADTQGLDSLLNTPISASAKYQQTARQAAGSVTIVTHEQIERFGYRTLADALGGVSGFYLSNDRNYLYLGARGFSRPTDYNNRLLLLVDGHPINEGIWGSAPIELPVDLQSLDRIEIVRGPGSAVYGTGAVFGVINLVTRPGYDYDRPQAEIRGGAQGRRGLSGVLARGSREGLDLALSGTWDATDGQDLYYPEYDSPATHNGVAHDLDWERRWQVHGRASRGDLSFSSMFTRRTKAIPTGAYDMTFDAGPASTLDSYGFAELAWNHSLDPGKRLRVRGFFDRYQYDGLYAYDTGEFRDWSRDEAVGGEATLVWDIGSAQHLTAGGEIRRYLRAGYSTADQGVTETFNVPNTVASVYLEHEFQPTARLTLLGGVRMDHYSTFGDAVTPRAAVLVEPAAGTMVKLLYGQAYRAPNVYEANIAWSGYGYNAALHEERARTLELVLQQRLAGSLLGTASVFRYDMDGLIDLTEDSTTGNLVYRNVGRARATGAELGLEVRLRPGALGYANYSYQNAHDQLTGARLTNSPAHVVKAGLSTPFARWIGGGLELRGESGRVTVVDTRTDDYVLGNLHLWVNPLGGGFDDARLQLSLRADNAFNTRYAAPGGLEHLQPAIAQDGRIVSAELRYRF